MSATALTSTRELIPKLRVAKFHAALIGAATVYAKTRRREAVRCFFRQGDLSSGCGVYCVATALSILGIAKASAMEESANRKSGVAREVFKALEHSYFDGISGSELYDALVPLDLPLKLTLRDAEASSDGAAQRKVVRLALTALHEGSLVMIAYRNERPFHQHWVLAVGCGGLQQGSRLKYDTIYVLDPGDETIPLSVYNAVLRRDDTDSAREHWLMQARNGAVSKVTLISAIRFDIVLSVRPACTY